MTDIEVVHVDKPSPRRQLDMDAGQRFRDALLLHQTVLTRDEILARRFMAVSLLDGSSDGHAYESRDEAVRFQRSHIDGNRCLYFQIPLERLPAVACESLIWYARTAYDAGYRCVGRDEGAELHIPTRLEEIAKWVPPTS